jgi:Spy/CpxP family protein refolding chaperone
MKMKVKYTTILAAVMALFLAGGPAMGQDSGSGDSDRGGYDGNKDRRMDHRGPRGQRGQRGPMEPEQMVRMLSDRLDLDDAQQAQVENIMLGAKPEFDALREKGKANRDAQRNLDPDDPDYGAKMQNVATTSGELAASATQLRGRIQAEINAILTPEQRGKLAEAPNRGRKHGQRHRGHSGDEAAAQ